MDHPDKKVYNHSLQDYVNVRYLSITETIRHGAKQYKSTLAILQLNFILRYAKKYGKPKNPKKGVKNQKDFEKMQELRCHLSNVGDVKLIVGIKKNREHIQYCITAVRT